MEIKPDTFKIEMTMPELKELRQQLAMMFNDICEEGLKHGTDIESRLREAYPKVNELLGILDVKEDRPF